MANFIVQTGNSGALNVRETKSTSSTKVGELTNGTTVNIVRCDATWSSLLFQGSPAFIQHAYLSGYPSINGSGLASYSSAVCNGNGVNIRNDADGSQVVGTLNKGNSVQVENYQSTGGYIWYCIGLNRWVRGDYLTPSTGNSGGGSGTLTKGFSFSTSQTNSNAMLYCSPSYSSSLHTGFVNGTVWTFTGGSIADAWREWLLYDSYGTYYYLPAKFASINQYSSIGVLGEICASGGLNLRPQPSTSTAAIVTLPQGTMVRIINETSVSGWWRIATIYGIGWVSTQTPGWIIKR